MSGSAEYPEKGKWTVEQPEGYFDAIQATGTMVAPIMAGFAFAVLALVLVPPGKDQADPLRWRDPVLALLVAAALLLIISTQAAILARTTLVKPGELMEWYPSSVEGDGKPDESIRTYQRQLQIRTARRAKCAARPITPGHCCSSPR